MELEGVSLRLLMLLLPQTGFLDGYALGVLFFGTLMEGGGDGIGFLFCDMSNILVEPRDGAVPAALDGGGNGRSRIARSRRIWLIWYYIVMCSPNIKCSKEHVEL